MVGIIFVQNLLHSQGIKIIHFDEHDNDIDDGHNNDIELIKKRKWKKKKILNGIFPIFTYLVTYKSTHGTGTILTRMSIIQKLRNFSKRLHIHTTFYLMQKKEGNMIVPDLR